MKGVPKYITSIQIQPNETKNINISLVFQENGAMMLIFRILPNWGKTPYT